MTDKKPTPNDGDPDHDSSKIIHVPPGGGHSFWVFGDVDIIKTDTKDTNGEMTFVETIVPPHSGPPLHIHTRESESIYVLDGLIRVIANGLDFHLEPGGFVHMPKNSIHRFENAHHDESRILLILLPSGIEGYFTELGTPKVEGVPSPGPKAKIEKLPEVAKKYGVEIIGPGPE